MLILVLFMFGSPNVALVYSPSWVYKHLAMWQQSAAMTHSRCDSADRVNRSLLTICESKNTANCSNSAERENFHFYSNTITTYKNQIEIVHHIKSQPKEPCGLLKEFMFLLILSLFISIFFFFWRWAGRVLYLWCATGAPTFIYQ